MRIGDRVRGEREVALAQQRYESLLAHDLLAFADHAAEFYLGLGADAPRAWELAQQNLANRETDRAAALAVRAAEATGRYPDACALLLTAQRIYRGDAVVLPQSVARDARGLRMAIRY